ncbi:hypothetical protein GCK72_022865 [Caenorhabditis remanei]|nr:hypothetical protein GCK72_022865 [Caenorhabditis remanei]KAF1746411.1 hypothetical protein GCK72_022865 [Caenorhabditis remanei]
MSSQNAGAVNPNPHPPNQMFPNAGTNRQETERQRMFRRACVPVTVVCAILAAVIYYVIMYHTGILK